MNVRGVQPLRNSIKAPTVALRAFCHPAGKVKGLSLSPNKRTRIPVGGGTNAKTTHFQSKYEGFSDKHAFLRAFVSSLN